MSKRNLQLDAALNNMGRAYACIAPMACSNCGTELHAHVQYPAGENVRRRDRDQVLAIRAAAGTLFVDMDSYEMKMRTALADRVPSSQTAELPDGRAINVRYRPMKKNGGWVATHADITTANSAKRGSCISRGTIRSPICPIVLPSTNIWPASSRRLAGHGSFAIARIDIDRFRETNDVYSQATGDAVLAEAGEAAGASLQRCISGTAESGDIFSIVSHLGAEPQTAEDLCARLSGILDNTFQIDGQHVNVRCSIGISGLSAGRPGYRSSHCACGSDARPRQGRGTRHHPLLRGCDGSAHPREATAAT